jgi:hypothetical protein
VGIKDGNLGTKAGTRELSHFPVGWVFFFIGHTARTQLISTMGGGFNGLNRGVLPPRLLPALTRHTHAVLARNDDGSSHTGEYAMVHHSYCVLDLSLYDIEQIIVIIFVY